MLLSTLFAAYTFGVGYVPLPPKEYDHPFKGKLNVVKLQPMDVHVRCTGTRQMLYGSYVEACAEPFGDYCTIVLPIVGKPEYLIRLRRHEVGHCNGWPRDHPGKR